MVSLCRVHSSAKNVRACWKTLWRQCSRYDDILGWHLTYFLLVLRKSHGSGEESSDALTTAV